GPNGATYIYGPQKGATTQDLIDLEGGMQHFQALLEAWSGKELNQIDGAGAAGGVGGGMSALFDASMQSGIHFFLEKFDIETQLLKVDLVITGEGKLDAQSPQGKLISGIAGLCQKHQKPLIAICGAVKLSAEETRVMGLTSAFSVLSELVSEKEALKNGLKNIEETTAQIANLIHTLKGQES
ncbi:MAG: glycerate kinase, partial [Saprospiraceae bacterium]|nr:glycerate kinase [Saprospiraceae bacterium]